MTIVLTYFSHVVRFIVGRNRRKPPTCHESLKNFFI